jgi:hydantoinase/carbamoylase family amidase
MPINPKRISRDIETIAGFNETTPNIGFSRPTFSKSWRKAIDYVIAQAEAAGCKTRTDASGNIHARPISIDWPAPLWLSGSHLDSVPTGGKFDGVVGVVAALEVLRSANDDKRTIPLELIIFAEEEGTTFGLGMIGSRLWTRAISPSALAGFLNNEGKTYLQAGSGRGVRPDAIASDCLEPAGYRGLIEIHIEQGPAMSESRTPIAVVTAISGRRQYKVELKGVANHAGSTPMKFRSDALVEAAKMICEIQKLPAQISEQTVATVGRIECEPNAINVIPGSVVFTVDLRSPEPADLDIGHARLQAMVGESDSLEANIIKTEDQPVVRMNAELVSRLRKIGTELLPTTISGALHDAAVLAPHIPTAMIFIASKDGISHNPAELSRLEDIADSARILEKLVSKS